MKNLLYFLLFLFSSHLSSQVTAEFSAGEVSGCSPFSVNFTDLSTGPVSTWFWNFGNGNTSNLQNPSAVYITPGTYTVSLTVTDGESETDTETKVSYIFTHENPVAGFDFIAVPTSCTTLRVSFSDESVPGSVDIVDWFWDFGDGATSNASNPIHTYTTPGMYIAELTVTDANGCTDTHSMGGIDFVEPLNIDFSATPLSSCSFPLTVNFTNESTGGEAPYTYLWDFGDGNISSLENPTHVFNSVGEFYISLEITSAFCTDSIQKPRFIRIESIQAEFSSQQTACAGETVTFSDLSTGNITIHEWDFGDGNTSDLANPEHVYAFPGTYTVSLITTGSDCNDAEIKVDYITVLPSPSADFIVDGSSACEVPFTVNFTDQSTGAVSWLWDFGDGNTSIEQNPSHNYTTAGIYPVTLQVTSSNSCTDFYAYNNIEIIEPVAAFTSNVSEGCFPLTVSFSDESTSTSSISSWNWDFGDGNTSSTQNPTHTFTSAGNYTVSLNIVNEDACTNTEQKVSYIIVSEEPLSDFTVNTQRACVNDEFVFTDMSTGATEWFWEFGDGTTSTLQNPSHTYQERGCYDVRLTASTNGCSDVMEKMDFVCINAPVARFVLFPSVGCSTPHTVFFTDQSTSPDTWFWNFGDGGTSTAQNPVHTYLRYGEFPVLLTVTDTINGCTGQFMDTVYVSNPSAGFTVSRSFGCGPLTTQFTSLSTGDIVSWDWAFGDDSTSTLENPSHTYVDPGSYSVTLTITDSNACTSTHIKTNYIQVIGPNVEFTSDVSEGCDELMVSFTDLTTNSAPVIDRTWNFGDGNSSSVINPTHVYTQPGTYTVSLTIEDLDGCPRTETKVNYISVTQPTSLFTVDETTSCVSGALNFTNLSSGEGLSYLWDFGDGNTSVDTNPTHAYSAEGMYTVSLSITDINGCVDFYEVDDLIEIIPFVADFDYSTIDNACAPFQVDFTAMSSFEGDIWTWDFGDGNMSNAQNPSHTYMEDGLYTVSLMVENDQGCSSTESKVDLIEIYQAPESDFIISDTIRCNPLTLEFSSLTMGASSWLWDFGDGNTSTLENPQHVYGSAGSYTICLEVSDGMCSSSSCMDFDGGCEVEEVSIPTMGTWGLICLSLIMLIFSIIIIKEKTFALQ